MNNYFTVLLKLKLTKRHGANKHKLLFAGGYDIVARSMNVFVSFLDMGKLFEEKSCNYDNSSSVSERGKKGKKTKK